MESTAAILSEGYIERLERLDRLDRLDARDARDAADLREARLHKLAKLERAEAADAADAVARGAELLAELAATYGQSHLLEARAAGQEAGTRRLMQQLQALDRDCPGGLLAYVARAKSLLASSAAGENPLAGYTPSIPRGHPLTIGTPEFIAYEAEGVAAAARGAAFVIVAGGLGERLGASGIKLGLPAEALCGVCYLELYIRHILALQRLSAAEDAEIPLILMTSDDTDGPTRRLLEEHRHFGMSAGQISLLRQSKVPCLQDVEARLAIDPNDRFQLLTKPHGHGDVHSLLHTSGIAKKLLDAGRSHLIFLQDTNALVFGGIPAALGVSIRHNLALNSVSVPRRAGDQSGALMLLRSTNGEERVVNVEYNQLDALIKASLDPRGDYNDDSGWSPFPGNTNQLIFALPEYVATLESSAGAVPEFVNPKYTDATRTAFKSPTRLECMMQDLPWLMPPSAAVSFTTLDASLFYCPVKNSLADAAKKVNAKQSPGCASAGDQAWFAFNAKLLSMGGAKLEAPTSRTIAGIPLHLGPAVSLLPASRPTTQVATERFKGAISLTARSALSVDGEVWIEHLTLDGSLSIRAAPGARVRVRHLCVRNDGHQLEELSPEELANPLTPEADRLRGYRYKKLAERTLTFDQPGEYIIDEAAFTVNV